MPIDSDLQAAGRRLAAQPVPSPPPIAVIEAGAARHTTRRRMLVSGAVMVMIVAMAFPLALTARGTSTVQTVTAGASQVSGAAAAQVEPGPGDGDQADDNAGDDAPRETTESGVTIELRSGSDSALEIRIIDGDQAAGAAASAEAVATETLDVDGLTVWVSGSGDQRTVSALVEDDEFVQVSGTATQLDLLIDVLRDGGFTDRGERQGLHDFDNAEWQAFFGGMDGGEFSIAIDGLNIEGFFEDLDGDFNLELDGDFDFDNFFGPDGFDFEDLDGDIEQFFGPDAFNFDDFEFHGDFDFDDFFGPDGFNFDDFDFDGDFDDFFGPNGPSLEGRFDDFDGCITIDDFGEDGTEAFTLEFPPGCSSSN